MGDWGLCQSQQRTVFWVQRNPGQLHNDIKGAGEGRRRRGRPRAEQHDANDDANAARFSERDGMERQRPDLAPSHLDPTVANTIVGIQILQSHNALQRVNEIADICFHSCVDDFGFTKKLSSGETQCLQTCVEKYLDFSRSSGSAFAESLQQRSLR